MKNETRMVVLMPRLFIPEMRARLKMGEWLIGLGCWIAGVGVEYKSTNDDEEK